jgi:hypothetical protein
MGAAASSRGAGESGAGEEQKAEGGDGRTIKFADEELEDDADRKQARNHAAVLRVWAHVDTVHGSGRLTKLSWTLIGRRRRRRRRRRRTALRRRRPKKRRRRTRLGAV